jgi:predicted DNA-binding transcriptional regulator AlpA
MASDMKGWMTMVALQAELGGVTRSTIDGWRADGRFPAPTRLPNGTLLWKRAVVADWLESLASA